MKLKQFLNLFIMGNIELILNTDEVRVIAYGTRQMMLDYKSLRAYDDYHVGLIIPKNDDIRVYIHKEV